MRTAAMATSSSSSTSSQTHSQHQHLLPFSLPLNFALPLPLELREHIYTLHFSSITISIRPATVVIESSRARKMQALHNNEHNDNNTLPRSFSHRSPPPRPLHSDLSLLQVNRLTHTEAHRVFLRAAQFQIDITTYRAFVPTPLLYHMRRISGGLEAAQILELGTYRTSTRRKHSIIGPFEPKRVAGGKNGNGDGNGEVEIRSWYSLPLLGFMVEEANAFVGVDVDVAGVAGDAGALVGGNAAASSFGVDAYWSVYSHWVF